MLVALLPNLCAAFLCFVRSCFVRLIRQDCLQDPLFYVHETCSGGLHKLPPGVPGLKGIPAAGIPTGYQQGTSRDMGHKYLPMVRKRDFKGHAYY
jgi:hypothetical protein